MLKRFKQKDKNPKNPKNEHFEYISGVVLTVDQADLAKNGAMRDLADLYWDPSKKFTPQNITICNELTKRCEDLSYLPNTKTIIVSDESFCRLAEQSGEFVEDVAMSLNLDRNQAVDAVTEFFKDRSLLVQQTGLPGAVYKLGSYTQTGGSGLLVYRTLAMAKLAGAQGVALVQAQPAILIALPTMGGLFFHGCGSLAGNNTVGRTFTTIGNFLNIPMALTETFFNVYVSPVVLKVTGLPTVLNYTQQMRHGYGLAPTEAMNLLANKDKSILATILDKKGVVVKSFKEWIIRKLS